MLRSRFCDYTDKYIFENGSIKISEAREYDAATKIDGGDKGVIFKIFVPLIECRKEINNIPKIMKKA